MPKFKLLGIAPYEELKHAMEAVSKEFTDLEIDVFTADLLQGKELAQKLYPKDYDAVISRGGTAHLIRDTVPIPVFDIAISLYDILGAIELAKNYTDHLAIVGYASITEPAHLICDILQYHIKIITLTDSADTSAILEDLKAQGYSMILCDAITNKTAIQKSLNTILVTSGTESIKHAFQQALMTLRDTQHIKKQNKLLTAYFKEQTAKALIVDDDLQTVYSNINQTLADSIRDFLRSKSKDSPSKIFYHTFNNNLYRIGMQPFELENETYYFCDIRKSTPPIIRNSFGVQYFDKEDIEKEINSHLLFTSFIQEKSRQLIDTLTAHYSVMIIFGENGTAKTSLAYTAFLQQRQFNQHLIVINSKLIDERTWKYLLNSANGPLVEEENTLLFKNVEQLTATNLEKLLTVIDSTKLLQRNNLLFTYNTKSNDHNEYIFNRIMTHLDCSSLYSPSVSERRNELSSLLTLLLNKLNIKCNREVIGFQPRAMEALLAYDWPRNFNQLEQVLKKLILSTHHYYISEHQVLEILRQEKRRSRSSSGSKLIESAKQPSKTLFDYDKEIILATLEKNNHNQSKTAKELGISRTTLWRYLKMD
ncbi:PrpR N-terminal domain-containing protein [Streptococcus sp. H31]|uniref:PrpR N-terminal domain-containing protein n=1 Tax=Streptococcus huangxiaojuni TaxID=3237239 RepID=UPI0034A4393A